MIRICILDENSQRPMPAFFENAFRSLGNECLTLFTQDSRTETLRRMVAFAPDLIVSVQNVALLAAELMTQPELSRARKAIFFYDDPISSHWLMGNKNPLFENVGEREIYGFIWDGYWAGKWSAATGMKCFSTHLSAETEHFFPEAQDLLPEIKHCVVFLGNVPRKKVLSEIWDCLPASHQAVARVAGYKIQRGAYGSNPFEFLEEALGECRQTDRAAVEHQMMAYMNSKPDFSMPLAPHIQLRRYVWLMGKRETRLRGLRAVAKGAPLAILSHLKDEQNMGKVEFSRELKPARDRDLLFIDTSKANYYQLRHLYASGALQFQTTDPQSIRGGIPYRVFQAAACRVPLLSDSKWELVEAFKPDSEIFLYQGENDLPDRVGELLKDPARLKEVAAAGWRRFLREHTWIHRVKKVLLDLGFTASLEAPKRTALKETPKA